MIGGSISFRRSWVNYSPALISGQTGLSVASAAKTTAGAGTVSKITVSGALVGDGSASTPAVSTGSPLTVSAQLTDASGNPVGGVNLVLKLTQSNSAPTVTVKGVTVAQNSNSGAGDYEYNIPTDATGTATAQVSVATGSTISYKAKFNAPYTVNGVTVASPSSYLQFVPAGSMALAPNGAGSEAGQTPSNLYQTTISSTSNTTTGLVPVVVTVPPVNGQAQSNVQVAFTVNAWNTGNSTWSTAPSAFFANAQGSSIGSGNTYTTYTNAQGQATVYVNDFNSETVEVKAVATGDSNLNNSTQYAYVQWGQGGVATQISNFAGSNYTSVSGSTYQGNVGQNVTFTGQAQDSAGNPVANAQLLLTEPSGHGSYVSGTTSTSFPSTSTSITSGTAVNSSYGFFITTDAGGNFSYTVTDGTANNNDAYTLYAVQNGSVVGNALNSVNVNWNPGTTLTQIGLKAADPNTALGNYFIGTTFNSHNPVPTSLTGISAKSNGTSTASVVFAPFNSYTPLTGANAATTYNVSVNNNASITTVDIETAPGTYESVPVNSSSTPATGSNLQTAIATSTGNANGVTSLAIPVSYNGTNYQVSVNGHPYTAVSPEVQVDVTNTTAENDTMTISSGSVKETAPISFTSSGADYASAFTPQSAVLNGGQSQDLKFTVLDNEGNPVPNSVVNVYTNKDNSLTNVFVTKVNGVALQQSENVANGGSPVMATEATPIPLGPVTVGSTPETVNYSVNLPGVANWSKGSNWIAVTTDGSGNVTLSVQSGDVSYFEPTSTNFVYGSDVATSTATTVYTFQVTQAAIAGGTINHVTQTANGPVISFGATNPGSDWNLASGATGNAYKSVGSITW